jgi:hypothetical protein
MTKLATAAIALGCTAVGAWLIYSGFVIEAGAKSAIHQILAMQHLGTGATLVGIAGVIASSRE